MTKRRRNGIELNKQQPTGKRDEVDSVDKEVGADEQDTMRPATHANRILQDGGQGVARSAPSFDMGVTTETERTVRSSTRATKKTAQKTGTTEDKTKREDFLLCQDFEWVTLPPKDDNY